MDNSNSFSLLKRDEIDLILKDRFPTAEELLRFPLGKELDILERRAWTRTMRAIDFEKDKMVNILRDIKSREEIILRIESHERDAAKLKSSRENPRIMKAIGSLRKRVEYLTINIDKEVRKQNKMLSQENISEIYYCHIRNAVAGVRILTKFDQKDNLDDKIVLAVDLQKPHISQFLDFLRNMKPEIRKFLRIVSLYHDIGKVYHRDRHPVLGRHLLESLSDKNRRDFLDLFKGEEEVFYQMLELVGHHDVFGMLCTGEASRTSLIDSSSLKLSDIETAENLIDGLVILNLGDIYGSIGIIPEERFDMIVSDWAYFKNVLQDSHKKNLSKRQIEENIIEKEQEPEMAAERIKRLLISMIMYSDRAKIEAQKASYDRKKILDAISSDDIIRSALVKQLGSSLSVFCSDFALVCKLDYMLRFLNSLANKWIDHCIGEYTNSLRQKGNKTINVSKIEFDNILTVSCIENMAVILIEILNRLVSGYSDLTRTRDNKRRRIGLELMGLSRSNDIGIRVIQLIIDGIRAEGMNWIADEATSWYLS
jgi:hypothetical protein